jgi:hypothetical protein
MSERATTPRKSPTILMAKTVVIKSPSCGDVYCCPLLGSIPLRDSGSEKLGLKIGVEFSVKSAKNSA